MSHKNEPYLLESIAYPLKPLALAGGFYCFNSLTDSINKPSMPGTITNKKVKAFTRPVA